ncbi:MAG: DNA translocase FtsK 4TM domain-containing protein, partial [Deltaproteobacteria bacterium]|nr:DNA translocase FtsK 4TM domain-containing protein [Deltaproteobacteria bacterium]
MANRRKALAHRKPDRDGDPAATRGRGPLHEALAVALAAAGVLTILALASYNPADTSLNASGTAEVKNWIGPAGAYWSDLLLQALGVGAYALGLGFMFAAWRALRGSRIRPGLREAAGTALLVISVGALAHLALRTGERGYPPGGIAGALLAELLRDHFALAGAYVLAGALALASLALTTDGVLAGLGLRGLGAIYELFLRAHVVWVVLRARRRRLRELRAAQNAGIKAAAAWTLGPTPVADRKDAKIRRVEQARARGKAMAEEQAARAAEKARRLAVRDISEPDIAIDRTIDLPGEDRFELGDLPALDDLVQAQAPEIPKDLEALLRPIERAPVSIRAAEPALMPEPAEEPMPPPAVVPQRPPPLPKRLGSHKARPGEPEIVDVRPKVDPAAIERAAQEKPPADRNFELPSATLLDFKPADHMPLDPQLMRDNAQRLTKTLKEYGIDGHVREIRPGPVVTMYEYVPAPGIKLSRIAGLADDLAMSMEALRVRIVAPIPGKGAVGIEIPNEQREVVYLKELIAHDSFRKARSNLTLALGKDIEGNAYMSNLASMPHLLVEGATGSGKSVSVNAMIMSILFKSTPDEVRMIMVDPKMLELSVYDGIPHLLLPVVTDPKKAALALRWAVEEMERRYHFLSELGVRNIDSYNQKVRAAAERGVKVTVPAKTDDEEDIVCVRMPYIVVIVDELADLMMVASREVEASIMRLAQMARAAGIHLILATQRPSVDVITGVIKANFPTRIAFQVASKTDSRPIIDANG